VSRLFGKSDDDAKGLGFDYVLVTLDSGEERRLTRREFEALPLGDRVAAILRGKLRFFRDDVEIPMKEAVRS
jgi:hypothetical protein